MEAGAASHAGQVREANEDVFGILLCSDGLWDCVPDDSIARIVLAQPDVELACYDLVDAANKAGAPDNVTALIVRVGR
ncbi:MAG TPA: hypothetical protein VIM14_14200 [Polyangia bacterium]|jgi:protein phosphatase